MLDFGFATSEEILGELGARLRAQRLAQLLTQQELADRAGVSVGTVKKLEASGLSSLDSLVRIALTLGLATHLEPLFRLEIRSIAQMEQAESARRTRAPRRRQR